jgi:hypothetical protein
MRIGKWFFLNLPPAPASCFVSAPLTFAEGSCIGYTSGLPIAPGSHLSIVA